MAPEHYLRLVAQPNMVGCQLGHAGHAQQLQGAGDLCRRMSAARCTPALAAGHQPVEVGAPDQRRAGAERHGGDDVAAGEDAAVDVDLGAVADGSTTAGSCSSGVGARSSWRPPWLETTTASAPASTTARASSTVRMPLTTSGPVPGGPQPGEVGDRRGRVEDPVDQLGDGAVEAVERGELQRLGGEQVEPPARVQRGLGERPQRQRRRDGEAVAHVAQPRAGDRGVDGEHQRLVARPPEPGRRGRGSPPGPATGRAGTTCVPPGAAAASASIEVVPMVDSAYGMPTRAATRPTAGSPSVCIMPGEAGRARRPAAARRRLPEDRRRRCRRRRRRAARVGLELDPRERLPRAAQADLLTGGAVGVVEYRARRPPAGQQPQVGDGRGAGQPTFGGVERHAPRTQQGLQLRPTRPMSGSHPRVLHDSPAAPEPRATDPHLPAGVGYHVDKGCQARLRATLSSREFRSVRTSRWKGCRG